MGSACMPGKHDRTIRDKVLQVLEESLLPMTGTEISHFSGLSYKQTIDALNALMNHGKVDRDGRKFTAKWERAKPKPVNVSAQQMILVYMSRPR